MAALFILLLPSLLPAQEITLIAGGDVEWSVAQQSAPAAYTANPGGWIEVPYLNLPENRDAIRARIGRQELDRPDAHHLVTTWPGTVADTPEGTWRHGFLRTVDLFRNADIAFLNLEMPISDRVPVRPTGSLGSAAYADALRWAGFDIISLANNRVYDAETVGLLDTIDALSRAGLGWIGAGRDLDEARKPWIVERNGLKVAFLAYTYGVSGFGVSAFALPDRPGVMPLDPFLIKEDIRRIRDEVDFVVLSFHWGIVGEQSTPDAERKFAHEMIDGGADVILGHHAHVPKGVEVYQGGVIFYSLANLTMGHAHDYWMDNYLARLTLTRGSIPRVELLPIAGDGLDVTQPYELAGERAQKLLLNVQELSARLGTHVAIEGDIGVIRPGMPQTLSR